jgi:hypothetical protein
MNKIKIKTKKEGRNRKKKKRGETGNQKTSHALFCPHPPRNSSLLVWGPWIGHPASNRLDKAGSALCPGKTRGSGDTRDHSSSGCHRRLGTRGGSGADVPQLHSGMASPRRREKRTGHQGPPSAPSLPSYGKTRVSSGTRDSGPRLRSCGEEARVVTAASGGSSFLFLPRWGRQSQAHHFCLPRGPRSSHGLCSCIRVTVREEILRLSEAQRGLKNGRHRKGLGPGLTGASDWSVCTGPSSITSHWLVIGP